MKLEIKFDFKIKSILQEVDWEGKYPDVKKKNIEIQELIDDLNNELGRIRHNRLIQTKGSGIRQKDRIRRPMNLPTFGTQGNLLNPKIDVEDLKRKITDRPKFIFSNENRKAKKTTAGGEQETWITGIPALWGVIFDEDANRFVYINTCPGAGSCMVNCYAKKGQFDINDAVVKNATNKLNFLMNDPDGYYQMALDQAEKIANRLKKQGKNLVLRWNESGDFFSNTYFDIATKVTDELIARGYNVTSSAYTKMGNLAKLGSKNFKIQFSTNANKRERNKIDVGKERFSQIVPRNLFRDGIFVKSGMHIQVYKDGKNKGKPIFVDKNAKDRLRKIIFDTYKDEFNLVDFNKLVYQDQLPKKIGKYNEYTIVMLPKGDTDIGAQRPDVRGLFILEH